MRTPFDAPSEWGFVASSRQAPEVENALGFVFQEGRLVVDVGPEGLVPRIGLFEPVNEHLKHRHFLGLCQGMACFSGELASGVALPSGLESVDLRRFAIGVQNEDLFAMASRAVQILAWDQSHTFCSRCGTRTEDHPRDFAKVCPACSYTQYPRISPCIIVLVTREDQVLLACGTNFSRPMYSTLAGFVEAGETLEQAVHREVWEETGILVKNLQYRSSQPWPFPHSLMVGFHAEYAGGEIVVDPQEIADAGWYPVSRLPPIPPHGSISRRLIEEYLQLFPQEPTHRGW